MNKELAETFLEETLDLKKNLEKNFLELGKRLMKIRDEQLFNSTHESFVEFLWEAKLTESTASKLINVYQKFVVELGMSEDSILEAGGWTVVYKLKDVSTDKVKAKEWLEKASVLSPKDLENELKESKTGIAQITCPHIDTIDFRWCKTCGEKNRIYADDN